MWNMVEINHVVAWASLLITTVHPQVAQVSKIHSLPATSHYTEWIDHRQVYYGSYKAISILTLWMSKRHMITLHNIIIVYNFMFIHMDGIMWAVAQKRTKLNKGLYFAVKIGQQMVSQYYNDVTSMMGKGRYS